MKKFVSLALSLCMLLSLLPTKAQAAGFPDMPADNHWAYAALNSAVENGLLNGMDGKLMPNSSLTRAQMAAIINRAFGAIDTGDVSTFSDVKHSDWFYTDIAKAVRMGTFQGNGNGKMNPNQAITREQAFTVIARAFCMENGNPTALAKFTDAEQVSTYAKGSLAALAAAGYINGTDGKLLPQETITRAEFSQVIYNILKNYVSTPGTYTENFNGNVIVNVPGVVFRNVTIAGDLILGEGVGSGEVTLDGVEIQGRLLVRGGGENSIILKNRSKVATVILNKTGDGGVRLFAEDGCEVELVQIPDGKDDVILEGAFQSVTVATDAPVVLKDAVIADLKITGENASVSTQGSTRIEKVTIEVSARGAALTVAEGSTVNMLISEAEGVTVDGDGTVKKAIVSGNNTAINTEGTDITVTEGTEGVTANGQAVTPKPTPTPTPTPDPDPDPDYSGEIEVTTAAELLAALKTYETIKVTADLAISEDLVVAAEQSLMIYNTITLKEGASITVRGYFANKGNVACDSESSSVTIVNGATYYGDGDVACALYVEFVENQMSDELYSDYSGYTVYMDLIYAIDADTIGRCVYTISNDTKLNTSVYSIDADTKIVVFGHLGGLSGKALSKATYVAVTTTDLGVTAANAAEINKKKVFGKFVNP